MSRPDPIRPEGRFTTREDPYLLYTRYQVPGTGSWYTKYVNYYERIRASNLRGAKITRTVVEMAEAADLPTGTQADDSYRYRPAIVPT